MTASAEVIFNDIWGTVKLHTWSEAYLRVPVLSPTGYKEKNDGCRKTSLFLRTYKPWRKVRGFVLAISPACIQYDFKVKLFEAYASF